MRLGPIIPPDAREKIVRRHENGRKQVALYYLQRKLVGHRSWESDGALALEYGIRNKLKHGVFADYYPDGGVSWVTHYVDGKEHGISRQYDAKGKLIGTYKMKHGTGVDLWYLAPGELHEERHFRDGKFHGFERWWKDRRTVREETHFKDDVLHGIKRKWTPTGSLRRGYPQYFINGKKTTKREYVSAREHDSSLPIYRKEDDKPARTSPGVTVKRKRKR